MSIGSGDARSEQGGSVEDSIRAVLDLEIRPLLLIHGGGIDLLSVADDGHAELEFQGACRGCALQTVTYAVAVRQRLMEVPGVTEVSVKGVRISKMALERTAAMYRNYSFRPGASAGAPARSSPILLQVPSRAKRRPES